MHKYFIRVDAKHYKIFEDFLDRHLIDFVYVSRDINKNSTILYSITVSDEDATSICLTIPTVGCVKF